MTLQSQDEVNEILASLAVSELQSRLSSLAARSCKACKGGGEHLRWSAMLTLSSSSSVVQRGQHYRQVPVCHCCCLSAAAPSGSFVSLWHGS